MTHTHVYFGQQRIYLLQTLSWSLWAACTCESSQPSRPSTSVPHEEKRSHRRWEWWCSDSCRLCTPVCWCVSTPRPSGVSIELKLGRKAGFVAACEQPYSFWRQTEKGSSWLESFSPGPVMMSARHSFSQMKDWAFAKENIYRDVQQLSGKKYGIS